MRLSYPERDWINGKSAACVVRVFQEIEERAEAIPTVLWVRATRIADRAIKRGRAYKSEFETLERIRDFQA